MRFSISKIKAFKSCRRMYQLKYIEGLEPVQKSEALETGKSYHALLEQLNKTGMITDCEDEYSKELAMARAYEKYIYPKFKVVSKDTEKWLEYDLSDLRDAEDTLVGIVDGMADDEHIVEHKTYGGNDTMENYEYNLLWDEQILAYMLMTGKRKAWYTVCRKPNIRQKQNETEQEFYERMVAWYDVDTDNKIKLLEIERTDEEVDNFKQELLSIAREMIIAEDQSRLTTIDITDPFYRNTCHCNMWGRRCEYSSVCLNYDPNQQYVEFVRKEKNYAPNTEEN